jgi:ribosomal protein S7
MPFAAGRCAHERVFPMQRVHDRGRPTDAYMWCCPCGFQSKARRENVPARWLVSGDNARRLAVIDERIADRMADADR